MISHLTLGTNNIEQAEAFYSQILNVCNSEQIYKSDTVIFYQFPGSFTKLSITKPHDGKSAHSGNGTMLALKLEGKEKVEQMYNLAIKLGAMCEGQPGPRNGGAYFGAYFRDLDGNKIAAFFRPE